MAKRHPETKEEKIILLSFNEEKTAHDLYLAITHEHGLVLEEEDFIGCMQSMARRRWVKISRPELNASIKMLLRGKRRREVLQKKKKALRRKVGGMVISTQLHQPAKSILQLKKIMRWISKTLQEPEKYLYERIKFEIDKDELPLIREKLIISLKKILLKIRRANAAHSNSRRDERSP